MTLRMLALLLMILVVAASIGCGETRSTRGGSTTFDHESANPAAAPSSPESSPARAASTPAESPRPVPTPEQHMDQEAAKAAPFVVKGEVRSAMPAYQVPQKLRERLQETRPDLVAPHSTRFEVFNQHLDIKAKDSSMTFTAVLRIAGKQDEAIELKCQFDQSASPWSCDQMYPTDPQVASQRRLQATVNCLDTHRCERVGVELFVVINGKTESQLFQNEKFYARKATSGDIDEESDDGVKTLDEPVPMAPGAPRPPRRLEKPRPGPTTAPVIAPEPEDLSELELDEVMEDANVAIEINPPIPTPAPGRGQYSIPGIETLRPETGRNVKVQAIGSHSAGYLRSGATLDKSGPGFVCRQRADRNFGTDLTIELLKGAAGAVERKFPNKSPFVIANISKQGGGRLCNPSGSCHKSHQTGLDVDIAFPSNRKNSDMWSLCGKGGCGRGASISSQFDEDRFWHFVKTLTCADSKPVIAMFVDAQIKRHLCHWVRNKGENVSDPNSCAYRSLQVLKHQPGHHNHVHVRFKCPGNRDCRDATVTLGRGTGC